MGPLILLGLCGPPLDEGAALEGAPRLWKLLDAC